MSRRRVYYTPFFSFHRILIGLLVPCKEIQIPRCGFGIPGNGFRIPNVSGIPDSLSCISDSKAQNPDSTSKNFPDSGIPIPYHGARSFVIYY